MRKIWKDLLLKWQLKRHGASHSEAASLAQLASKLSEIELPVLSSEAKSRIAADIGFKAHPHHQMFVRAWQGAALVAIVSVLVFAQFTKPGSALYGIKKGSDSVRNAAHKIIPFVPAASDDSNQELEQHDDSTNRTDTDDRDATDDTQSSGTSSGDKSDSDAHDDTNTGSDSGSNSGSGSNSDSGGSVSTDGGSNSGSSDGSGSNDGTDPSGH